LFYIACIYGVAAIVATIVGVFYWRIIGVLK
jgi:hypothetical protein